MIIYGRLWSIYTSPERQLVTDRMAWVFKALTWGVYAAIVWIVDDTPVFWVTDALERGCNNREGWLIETNQMTQPATLQVIKG